MYGRHKRICGRGRVSGGRLSICRTRGRCCRERREDRLCNFPPHRLCGLFSATEKGRPPPPNGASQAKRATASDRIAATEAATINQSLHPVLFLISASLNELCSVQLRVAIARLSLSLCDTQQPAAPIPRAASEALPPTINLCHVQQLKLASLVYGGG